MAVFFEKKAKNRFWSPSLFWREGGDWRRKWILLFFMRNEVLNIFSFNNFFEKCNNFGENGWKIFLGDTTICLEKGSSNAKNEYFPQKFLKFSFKIFKIFLKNSQNIP